jgi:hypothetical protein
MQPAATAGHRLLGKFSSSCPTKKKIHTHTDLLCCPVSGPVSTQMTRKPSGHIDINQMFFGLDGERGKVPDPGAFLSLPFFRDPRGSVTCDVMTGPGRVPFDVWG